MVSENYTCCTYIFQSIRKASTWNQNIYTESTHRAKSQERDISDIKSWIGTSYSCHQCQIDVPLLSFFEKAPYVLYKSFSMGFLTIIFIINEVFKLPLGAYANLSWRLMSYSIRPTQIFYKHFIIMDHFCCKFLKLKPYCKLLKLIAKDYEQTILSWLLYKL